MTSGDITNRQFLALVRHKTEDARELHRNIAGTILLAQGVPFREMSFGDATKNVLLQIMRHDASVANRARAADLFLMGKDRHWATEPGDERDARALVTAYYERKVTVPKLKQPKIKPRASNGDDTKRHLAIMRASMELDHAMKHGANAAAKLDAIEAWFQQMACVAPDDLRASLAKTKAELSQ